MVFTRVGTLLVSADEFRITVRGAGGHASMPHDATDPVPVACEIVTALQSMVTWRVPVFDPAVLTVTEIHAGTAFDVIPETAVCNGTVRAVSDRSRDLVVAGLGRVAGHVAQADGCTADVAWLGCNYPVTVNDEAATERTLRVAAQFIGEAGVARMPNPVTGAGDWSYVLQRVPGSMAFLGGAPRGVAHPAPNHSSRMVLDEAAMTTGIALHAAMALD
ncbi:MAG TPA: M20/M25/M40 family metallo-hydrolase [Acidimicrobiales bacterium]